MKRRQWTPVVAIVAALTLAACSDSTMSGPSGTTDAPGVSSSMHVPTAANDGLTERDISGLTATDFATGGTGTTSREEETLEVTVPSDATVTAVYLYWARRGSETDPGPAEILVGEASASTLISGSIIGGPVDTPDDEGAAVSFRADITDENLVGPGTSTLTVKDAPGATVDEPLGASVLVFYETSGSAADLSLYDGVDFVWLEATAPDADQEDALQTAVPVTFEFASADVDRSADLTLFIGDIEDPDRPNSLEITVDGSTVTLGSETGSDPVFQAFEGPEWDNFVQTLTIPAGATEMTVEPISGPGEDPASLVWSLAALSIEAPPPPGGGEGCTPGFWRQEHHFDSWESYNPEDDKFGDVFDLPDKLQRPEHNTNPSDLTLHEGLELRGGGVNALIRHAVAALLNAASGDVDYDLTESQVIDAFNDAIDGGDVEGTKDELEGFNEQGCPLD